MKDKIQQLIQWAEVREKAFSACTKVFVTESAKFKSIGRLEENAFWKQQLMLLLSDKPTVAITETAHCANTEIVKQNEQTKECCHDIVLREYPSQNYGTCAQCGTTVWAT